MIVGNPPYSAGQQSAGDDNPNVSYPQLEQRLRETFVARSTAANKRQMYDSYKLAIRWACDPHWRGGGGGLRDQRFFYRRQCGGGAARLPV